MATVSPPIKQNGNGSVPVTPNGPPPVTVDHTGMTPATKTLDWGDTAPLALCAFGTTIFMLSMVNATAVTVAALPIVFAVALMFGGLVQLIAGIGQFRIGKVLTGVIFSGFGGFWLSLFAYAEWMAKAVPAAQQGHALGLMLYAFGIFAVVCTLACFRSSVMVVVAMLVVIAALFLSAAGNYGANLTLIHWGGYVGLAVAGLAFYLAAAELCELVYGRAVLPVWPLSEH